MLAAVYDEFSPGCLKQMEILEVNNEILRKAQQTFENYKSRNVILNHNFNHLSRYFLNFSLFFEKRKFLKSLASRHVL